MIATVSLAWGNLAALVQSDVKRMLAYSSISHAGFLLMPVAAANAVGGRALLYYLIPYAAMSIGAFAIVAARERELVRPVTFPISPASAGSDHSSASRWPCSCSASSAFRRGPLPRQGVCLRRRVRARVAVAGDRRRRLDGRVGLLLPRVLRAMYMQPPEVGSHPRADRPPRRFDADGDGVASLVVTVGSFIAADPLLDTVPDAVAFLDFPH